MPRRVAVALVLACCVVAPSPVHAALPAARPPDAAALRAAGLRVAWPIAGTAPVALAGGAPLRVRVSRAGRARGPRRARARVALVRVDGRGRPMRIVARRALTAGTFTARLPARAGARYALRLRVGKRRWWSFVVTPAPGVAAPSPEAPQAPQAPGACPATGTGAGHLRLEPAAARAGETVTANLTNTGSGCLFVGADYRWDALLPDGSWEPVESDVGFPVLGPRAVRPGETFADGVRLFDELQPGPHRLVKTVEAPDDELILYARLEVLPPSAR